ncbi:MAG: hypothetical protein E7578_09125 [Ruminococcaceae bacterium]|nr:hypothetical protein [Oscillospiraceae bacterium]
MSRVLRAVLAVILCVVLTSCSFGVEYSEEQVKKELPTDGELAKELSEMIQMLTVNSPILPEFEGIGEAMDSCRDSVLFYMLAENFGKYSGNIEKLDAAVAEYPLMQITNLIPAREFEETVYTAFGGTKKISNESGRIFVYLDKVASYTSVTMLDPDPVDVSVLQLSETENTYRMRVKCSAGEVESPEYTVIFVKREDDTAYFHSVTKMK